MTKNLMQERINNFVDTTSFREPKKIPVDIQLGAWPLAYGGATYADIKKDPVGTANKFTKFLDDVPIDVLAFDADLLNDPEVFAAMGSNKYVIGSDGITVQHNQAASEFMTVEDYPQLIKDYVNFSENVLPKRRISGLNLPKKEAYAHIKLAAESYATQCKFNEAVNLNYKKRQIPRACSPFAGMPSFSSPINVLFEYLRGFQGTMIDLRRNPELVREACAEIAKHVHKSKAPSKYKGKPFPLAMTLYHIECFINEKQYDEFYFEPFKKFAMPYIQAGMKFFLKGEGMFLNTLDRFRDLPKGSMVIMLDQDDQFEAHKIIGDWQTIMAGISVDQLKCSSKEKNLDFAKRCIDTMAPGGGFIFSMNKPLMCKNDVNIQNLLAVYQFADKYTRK